MERGQGGEQQRRPPPGKKPAPQDGKTAAPPTGGAAPLAGVAKLVQQPPKQAGRGIQQQQVADTAVPAPRPPPAATVQALDARYKEMTCFNCSLPGHYVGNCIEPKKCFICAGGHNVKNCAAWAKPHPTTTYFGSAAAGLGFYHIDVPTASELSWLNYKNCADLKVVKGEVSASELLI